MRHDVDIEAHSQTPVKQTGGGGSNRRVDLTICALPVDCVNRTLKTELVAGYAFWVKYQFDASAL